MRQARYAAAQMAGSRASRFYVRFGLIMPFKASLWINSVITRDLTYFLFNYLIEIWTARKL